MIGLARRAELRRLRPMPELGAQQGQVVEADGDGGMLGAEALLVDGERAAISGSASASRLVACSSTARLLRRMATLGCSGPKLFSSMASARR